MTDPNDWAAALQRIAELESQLAFERERYELLAMDYAGADADRKAQPPAPDPSDRVRIAELESEVDLWVKLADDHLEVKNECAVRIAQLESAVQHADKVVEQLTTERDAALDRLQKAREWLSDGHADLVTLGGILRHD